MKKLAFILMLCTFTVMYGQQKADSTSIVGKWTPTAEFQQSPSMEFFADGTCQFSMQGGGQGGDMPEGMEMPKSKYKLDTSKSPMWLDMLMEFNGESMNMKALAQFIDAKTLKIEMFQTTEERPTKFSEPPTQMMTIMKKK